LLGKFDVTRSLTVFLCDIHAQKNANRVSTSLMKEATKIEG
jgi:hypothetical protein